MPPVAPAITLPPDTEALQARSAVARGLRVDEAVLAAAYNVIAPKPIVLYLELYDTIAKERAAIHAPHAHVRPFDKPEDWTDVVMVDCGTGADEVAGDKR